MKYSAYFEDHDNENFSWCKPYTDKTETYYAVMYNGDLNGIATPKIIAQRWDGSLTDEVLCQVVKEIVPDYDYYQGYTDQEILLENMHETGCYYCPFKEECEVYNEEMEETDWK